MAIPVVSQDFEFVTMVFVVAIAFEIWIDMKKVVLVVGKKTVSEFVMSLHQPNVNHESNHFQSIVSNIENHPS